MIKAIVIGASAGALEALSTILPGLPGNYPLPILVVVHLPSDKPSVMPQLLQSKCALSIKEAEDKEPIEPGVVYFAPPDYHLQAEEGGMLSLSSEEPVMFSRPSIDILFETAADVYGEGALGIILTGANSDGAEGLRMICTAGGTALIQDPNLAYASAMPDAAIKTCPQAEVLSLDGIAAHLQKAAFL